MRKSVIPRSVEVGAKMCFGKEIIPFVTFFREVTYKVYEAFYGLLESGKFDWYLRRHMDEFSGHVNPKMLNLLRNREREGVNPMTFEKMEELVKKNFGDKSFLAETLIMSQRMTPEVEEMLVNATILDDDDEEEEEVD